MVPVTTNQHLLLGLSPYDDATIFFCLDQTIQWLIPYVDGEKKTIVSTVPSGKHWQFAKISIFAKSTNVPNFLWAIDGHCQ